VDIGEKARGTTNKVPVFMRKGERVKLGKDEAYLLSACGNPFSNVVKTGDNRVFVSSVSGLKFEVPGLVSIHNDKSYKTKDG
jgi:hypothetical protein